MFIDVVSCYLAPAFTRSLGDPGRRRGTYISKHCHPPLQLAQSEKHTENESEFFRTCVFYIEGVQKTFLSKVTYNKCICHKKEKQQYVAVGRVRMFIEPSVEH